MKLYILIIFRYATDKDIDVRLSTVFILHYKISTK